MKASQCPSAPFLSSRTEESQNETVEMRLKVILKIRVDFRLSSLPANPVNVRNADAKPVEIARSTAPNEAEYPRRR